MARPNDDFRLPGAESQRAVDLLEEKFPAQNPYTSQIVFSDDEALAGRRPESVVASTLEEVAALPHVVAVSDPYDAAVPDAQPGRADGLRHGHLRHQRHRADPSRRGRGGGRADA